MNYDSDNGILPENIKAHIENKKAEAARQDEMTEKDVL